MWWLCFRLSWSRRMSWRWCKKCSSRWISTARGKFDGIQLAWSCQKWGARCRTSSFQNWLIAMISTKTVIFFFARLLFLSHTHTHRRTGILGILYHVPRSHEAPCKEQRHFTGSFCVLGSNRIRACFPTRCTLHVGKWGLWTQQQAQPLAHFSAQCVGFMFLTSIRISWKVA